MKTHCSIAFICVIFAFVTIQEVRSQTPPLSHELEEAVLASDWQTIYRITTEIPDSLQSPIERVLAYTSCLALDCNDFLSSVDLNPAQAQSFLDWARGLCERNPDSSICMYFSGVAFQTTEEHERAITYLKKTLTLDSTFFMAHILLGNSYFSQGNMDAAIVEYTHAIRIKPENSKGYTNRGGIYGFQKLSTLALRDYEAALKINSDDPMIYYNRGNSYRHVGDLTKAIKDQSRVIEMKPDFANAYLNRANSYADLERWSEAISDYKRFIFLAPSHMGKHVSQARASAQSITNREFFNRFPKVAERYNKGVEAAQRGKFDKALKEFDKALELNSEFALIYMMRGLVYTNIANRNAHEKGLVEFARAIELEPDDFMTYLYRAKLYNRLNLSDSAIMDCNKALLISPNNLEVIFNRAFSYQVVGKSRNNAKSIEDLTRILNVETKNTSSLRLRANAYKFMSDTVKALADYEAYLKYAPHDHTRERESAKADILELKGDSN